MYGICISPKRKEQKKEAIWNLTTELLGKSFQNSQDIYGI